MNLERGKGKQEGVGLLTPIDESYNKKFANPSKLYLDEQYALASLTPEEKKLLPVACFKVDMRLHQSLSEKEKKVHNKYYQKIKEYREKNVGKSEWSAVPAAGGEFFGHEGSQRPADTDHKMYPYFSKAWQDATINHRDPVAPTQADFTLWLEQDNKQWFQTGNWD